MINNCLCKQSDFDLPWFKATSLGMGWNVHHHRKLWEFVFVTRALFERGCLKKGMNGLGFAVGKEQLPAVFARSGCNILATDYVANKLRKEYANIIAETVNDLNSQKLCPQDIFDKQVSYMSVDMRNIPPYLVNFDFTWSCCSFEHLGSIELGLKFYKDQMNCLKSGGWAVHTTEYNISSDTDTLDVGNIMLFRKQDMIRLARELEAEGHYVEMFDFDAGNGPEDKATGIAQGHLLKYRFDKYIGTSIIVIARKK